MFGLGTQELVLIFLVVFFLFGAAKLPQIARDMGEFIKTLRGSVNEPVKIKRKRKKKVADA